jgi:hypothetical protein
MDSISLNELLDMVYGHGEPEAHKPPTPVRECPAVLEYREYMREKGFNPVTGVKYRKPKKAA